jgi:hypothetical protein
MLIPHVTLNSFQGPFIRSSSGRIARWILKQVQDDGEEMAGRQGQKTTTATRSNLQCSFFFSGLRLFTAAAGEPDRDQRQLV